MAGWLVAERGRLLPWVPVCMGIGAGGWFGWPWHPGPMEHVLAFLVAVLGFMAWRAPHDLAQPLGAAVLGVTIGFLAAASRSDLVAAPVLTFRYYGPVEGRVLIIDRSGTDQMRLTLDQVILDRVEPSKVPGRVRISLHGDQRWVQPQPGMRVMMTAHLQPPGGAAEPGGFDFQRFAWFRGIGAVGWTRTPVLARGPPAAGDALVTRLRMSLSAALQAAIPGEPGAFAAAMLTGDRSGMGQAAVSALRDSSLYHLVSISGMHMGLLAGFVFVAVRGALALVPPLALRLPGKKIAAVIAILAASFYLLLSGGDIATERSWVMVVVMLGAVLLDRRAISLRSVALAAIVLLVLQPESVIDAGFQMSFAATLALVVGFRGVGEPLSRRLPGWTRPPLMLVLSSLLAGLATAPFAAAHFNRFTDYGLLANLLAGPLMGMLVMPAGVMAAVLAPLGLAAPALWLLGLGTAWILNLADWVAGLSGAVRMIPEAAVWVVPMVGLAGAALLLVPGRARWLALPPLILTAIFWQGPGRPALLVSDTGSLLGLDTPGGRALSSDKGAGHAARAWLEADGDLSTQAAAARRPGFSGPKTRQSFQIGAVQALHLTGKNAPRFVEAACAEASLVILAAKATGPPPQGCVLVDQTLLGRTGALAITVTADGLRLVPTRPAHPRPWNAHEKRGGDPPPFTTLTADLNRRALPRSRRAARPRSRHRRIRRS